MSVHVPYRTRTNMPGCRVPIVFKGTGNWVHQFQKDLEKQLSGFTLQPSSPHTLQADEDVIIVCPSYSRLEADLDLALQGINGARNTGRQIVVLYIHNVTEHQLSGLNTQRDVDSDLQDRYSGIRVIDIGVNDNTMYKSQRNKDSMKMLTGILKRKDDSSMFGFKMSLPSLPSLPSNPFSSSKSTAERQAPVPTHTNTGIGSPVDGAAQKPADKSPILPKPWRDVRWDTNHIQKLQTEIQKTTMPEHLPTANILVLGQSGSGKKSFGHFVADTLNCPFVDSRNGCWIVKTTENNFRLVGAEGMPPVPINQWMQTILPPAEMGSACSAMTSNEASMEVSVEANLVSCVVFVASAKDIWSRLDGALEGHLEDIRKRGIPRLLIITHTEVCPVVDKEIRHMYLSKWMKDIIERGAELYQMPVSNVHAVKSYSNKGPISAGNQQKEPESTAKNILLLRALLQAVQFTSDYLERC